MDTDRVTYRDILDHGYWRHRIDLGDGQFTPGNYRDASSWSAYGLPEDMSGKSFLDVGAADGLFAIEAERRGADHVLATDLWGNIEQKSHFDDSFGETASKRGIDLVRSFLDSDVRTEKIDVLSVSPETVGTFDVVFCSSVLNYVSDPLTALENLVSVTTERLVVRNTISARITDVPMLEFVRDETPDVWHPNPSFFVEAMCDAGIAKTDVFHPDEGQARVNVPTVYTGRIDGRTVAYTATDLTEEQIEIPESAFVDILCEYEDVVRVEYRPGRAVSPRQGWIPTDRVTVFKDRREELLAKAKETYRSRGTDALLREVGGYLAETLRDALPVANRPPSGVVVHGHV